MHTLAPLTPNDCFRLGLPFPTGTTEVDAWHAETGKKPELRTHTLEQTVQSEIETITTQR